ALMSLAAGTPQVTPEEVDLQALAEIVWGELTDETAVAEATLESDGLPSIRTDRALLGLVMRHLLTNALTYRGEASPQ
ncbi:sensor histidine kinase, partial [Rhizobium brockwellii]